MELFECVSYLRSRNDILILTHKRPDGDTLGSAAALCHALKRLGKTAYVWNNPEVTSTYWNFVAPFIEPDGGFHDYKTLVAVDLAGENMIPAGAPTDVDLCLDHHPTNSHYAENTIVWGDRASCGELILEVIKELCGDIDKEEANLLYVAVSTDTGCFMYANTTPDTFRAGAELVEKGADNKYLNKLLFRTFSKSRLTLEGLIFSSLRSYKNDQINVAIVTLDMIAKAGATEDDCDDLASLAGKVAGNKVAITIRELGANHSKASVRSTDEVSSSALCAKFGGGGHAMAAGCEVNCGPYELESMMLTALEEIWP